MVHSPFLTMRFGRFLAFLVAPAAIALGASCAPLGIYADAQGTSGPWGAGGSPYNTATSTTLGSGGSSGLMLDGGADAALGAVASYLYLCGGSHAACTPGPVVDQCAQGGNPGMGGAPPDASGLSCQLVPIEGDGGVAAQCGTSGTGVEGAPCSSAADCGPELGCVAGLTPTCRSYCCPSLEACAPGDYCVKAAMADAPQNQIPVCIAAQSCPLLGTTCTAGLTCAIVRLDGTTSCVTAGVGTDGQACPCAPGYTCSLTDNTCLKLCHTADDAAMTIAECGVHQLCQGGSKQFPGNIGYCVHE